MLFSTTKHAKDVQDGPLPVSPKSPCHLSLCLRGCCAPLLGPQPGKIALSKSFFMETNKHLRISFNTCSTEY